MGVKLRQETERLPSNECDLLMKRMIANQSWFDRLASFCVEQPLLIKIGVFVGVTASFGLIGLLISAPFLLALSAAFCMLIVQGSLESHHKKRWDGARLLASETKALNDSLTESQALLTQGIKAANAVSDTLTQRLDVVTNQAASVTKESVLIQQTNETLLEEMSKLGASSADFLSKKNEITDSFMSLSQSLTTRHKITTESIEHIEGIGQAASQFSQAVKDIDRSQQEFTSTVNRFSLFVKNRESAMSPALRSSDAKLDENDLFIEALKKLCPELRDIDSRPPI